MMESQTGNKLNKSLANLYVPRETFAFLPQTLHLLDKLFLYFCKIFVFIFTLKLCAFTHITFAFVCKIFTFPQEILHVQKLQIFGKKNKKKFDIICNFFSLFLFFKVGTTSESAAQSSQPRALQKDVILCFESCIKAANYCFNGTNYVSPKLMIKSSTVPLKPLMGQI